MVIVDRGYLTIQRQWRNSVAQEISCPLIQVESDVVIPIETTSSKEEFSAATIRPKIQKNLQTYLKEITVPKLKNRQSNLNFKSLDLTNINTIINFLDIDTSVKAVQSYHGGASEAEKHLTTFIKDKLDHYPNRNDPTHNIVSNMSPYLHFGQISPLYIARRIMHSGSIGTESYLEELIIRRELSMNYVFYNKNYDKYIGLPDWSQATLNNHCIDKRPYIYSLDELEHAETHDPYWNAAQHEMMQTGKMHSYMRMYWGKKIIEWTEQPEKAYEKTIYLNNKYELDGRDPNGYTGIAWCYGKHDHPWKERAIFGKIRYMNDKGLERKFDIHTYARWNQT
jgi:deoxyribodipyrimidine photo-lyase